MLNSKGFQALEALKEKLEAERLAEQEQLIKESEMRQKAFNEKYGFRNAEELIDYIKSGKKVVSDFDGDSFQMVDGAIEHIYMAYNDIDMPIGRECKYKTFADFKKWVYAVLETGRDRNYGYIPSWFKERSE